ncbi:aspartyl-phosphate phosphatase Spo0E family protein [Geobacillus thermodenitrificans]|uniref:aspartyl-phosphate phosphatase Spo0E family protein n=1 Tax=Geobacillus thermodenitrificans TaxID=33940 RepID=UPI000C285C16|nr:aspartyl-phosphate phosphatase Spo0E family protein [Geobacillus thermodenitrificans]MED3905302.1 aspartyl-phosphate phosphatase Spo0E family protein [Geobacillus thermodenitrificans]PJW21079.1 aspartyl-phosphate phosphatase Spo0E family protein [Geobacillus thermodenitrificans]
MPKRNLLILIEQKRMELVDTVAKTGLNSAATMKVSRELDTLLNAYQREQGKQQKQSASR